MNRSKISVVVFAVLVLAMVLAPVALAAHPHLIYVRLDGNVVSFKIAGLGANETITVTAGATATAEFWCQNNGGNYPDDPKKQQFQQSVSRSGPFTSGKNGQITGSLTLPGIDIVPVPFCPNGQHEVLQGTWYSNPWVTW